jgi:predicted P-loop ATPase/GTPase
MDLLVAGADRVDAGKTTFSVGLLARTGGVGFKPRAGNDYWFDHDDYRDATERGRLFGKDARKLAAASSGDREPEEINPVHRLWRPTPAGGSGLLGREDREFVLDRAGDRYVVNETTDLPASARETLDLDDAVRVDSLEIVNEAIRRLHLPAQQALLADVQAVDRAVVESYADIARPVGGFEPNAVAVVDPGRVRVYDGPRYCSACEVATGSPDDGRLEERVPAVADLVDPKATVDLPALSGAEREDPTAVADAYDHAYDAVLAVAVE